MELREYTTEEVSVDATQTTVREHLEFDRMCSTLEEFEHLPAISASTLEHDDVTEDEEPKDLDQLILAGLVTPV
jgi:hypothetical protein